MAAYVTSDVVRRRAGGSLDLLDSNGNQAVTDGEITEYIAAAQEEVDGLMAQGGYTVPFVTVPRPIMEITRDLATANAMEQAQMRLNATADNKGADKLRNTAEARLKRLRVGLDHLIDPTSTTGALLPRLVNDPFPVDQHPLDFCSSDDGLPLAYMLPYTVL